MNRILIIKDLRDWLWSTYPDWETLVSLDVSIVEEYFKSNGFVVEITSFKFIDLKKDYKNYYVIYGSAEDYCGGSKNFIEDILLHLKRQGAILLPEFDYFRAHDNKVMMEILREAFTTSALKTITSNVWSSLEELKEKRVEKYPVIVKRAAGAGGEGVFLAHNQKELYKYAEKVSRLINLAQFWYLTCVNLKQKLIKKTPVRIHNTKFITQNYIEGLDGDFKVLVFGNHYFVLHRLNRKNDFRASGSGQFTDDNGNGIYQLLDFAKTCKNEIIAPCLSLDIGFDGKTCHLIEFQCVTFGFKAMSMSKRHYEEDNGKWKIVEGKVIPEEEFSQAILDFINHYKE